MSHMLSLTMNDAAAEILAPVGATVLAPPGGLAPRLRALLAEGITRQGDVLTWASSGNANGAPSFFRDLTAWECADSSFHLEDLVPVDIQIIDDAPQISEDDQRILLLHGIAFAVEFRQLVTRLDRPGPVRCIVGANETNATFRFHQIRAGESWHDPDLDSYRMSKMAVIDLRPAGC
ncbi:hypothetical protein I3F58_21105 [Streptomyces sp. MUM 203J]|uniref:hypothetical protein n=1 Tax=Streptomyces sp. MUM 203J TaxID=2791990 RepID=UPI001F04DC1A|nr:hypothetical protein [Streptomyces sp. MUM 203J]MCH0542014.1 hypothetical protein [Streptomyces sp. MUM 203J]